jgi:arylsulfatase A-like enzyme
MMGLMMVALSCALFGAPARGVVLIVADDLGARDLGCDGSKYHKTPNLDALAKSGARFSQASSACPVCSPSRAGIMTGRHPARFGVTDWLPGRPDMPGQQLARPKLPDGLPTDAVTIGETFSKAGFATGYIGKWHLGGQGKGPSEQGFAFHKAASAAGSPASYFAPYRSANGSVIPGLEQAPPGEYLTDRLSREAADFIRANSQKPFLLVLAHYAPHTPMKAPEATVAKYARGRPGQQGNPVYAAMIEHLDNGVGLILQTLKETGRDADTIVAFTSDNGGLCTREGPETPATSNAPLREGKGYLYEGGIRVPLIIRAPGHEPRVIDAPANGIDLFPTLAELSGVKAEGPADGVSLAGALKGEAVASRPLFWHYPHYANQGGKPGGAIRDGRWKLVEFYETGRRELFDLQADPSESRNLALDQPDRVAAMAKALDAWRKQAGAIMPTPNAAYRPNPPGKDGVIRVPGSTARVEGAQLRFEPQPHKNTLGFWVRPADFASFEITVEKEGPYLLRVVQGCGKGSGGAKVAFGVAGTTLEYTVEDTGGFQNWATREVGTVNLKPGRATITVKPLTKPGVAVMDLQEMTLTPAKGTN